MLNNAAVPTYRARDGATGLEGLAARLREYQQPRDHGSDCQVSDVARIIAERAIENHHPKRVSGDCFQKIAAPGR